MSSLFELIGLKDPYKAKQEREQQEIDAFMSQYMLAQQYFEEMHRSYSRRLSDTQFSRRVLGRSLKKIRVIPHLDFLLGGASVLPTPYQPLNECYRDAHVPGVLQYECCAYAGGFWVTMRICENVVACATITTTSTSEPSNRAWELVDCAKTHVETLVNMVQLYRMLRARVFADGEILALFSVCPENMKKPQQQAILFRAFHDGLTDVYSTGRTHITTGCVKVRMERCRHIGRVQTKELICMLKRIIDDNKCVFPKKLSLLCNGTKAQI